MPEETLVKLIDQVEGGALGRTETKMEALRTCLAQLRPVDRGLILRRYYDENSLGELASEVGRNAESLKVSLHRIRVSLKGCVTRRIRMEEAKS